MGSATASPRPAWSITSGAKAANAVALAVSIQAMISAAESEN
jgi:hypothetical protein